jgi:hypothetical protein
MGDQLFKRDTREPSKKPHYNTSLHPNILVKTREGSEAGKHRKNRFNDWKRSNDSVM